MLNSSPLPSAESEWAAFAAIDWADQKHFWRLVPTGSDQQEQGELENTPEAVETWAVALQERFAGRPIALCLEQSRGALVYMLAKYAHLVLFPVHSTTAARYRETFCPSGAKDDLNDTASLLDLLLRHRERLRQLEPDTVETRLLQFLVEERRRAVDEKTRQSNRLKECLKRYFPQLPRWFEDVTTTLVGALIERWPNLEELQRAHPGTLRRFFHQHHCRSEDLIRERIDAISHATSATKDAALLEAGAMTARGLVALISTLRRTISDFDQRIEQLVATHPEGALFASLPGAGPALAPRLIVAFGTRRDRYQDSYQMLCYSGIAPVKEASGRTEWIHFRRSCPKFLRQTFHEFASHSIGQSEWAKAYYQSQRARQKNHHAAVRALAYKWIRIIFRCWKDGTPYDEQVYLQSQRRREALLGPALAVATSSGWQQVAGFQKFSRRPS
jgi:transposase